MAMEHSGFRARLRPLSLSSGSQNREERRNQACNALFDHGILTKYPGDLVHIQPYELPLKIGNGRTGDFTIHPFIFNQGTKDEDIYFVAVRGDLERMKTHPPVVRLQSFCPHGHALGSAHCDCGSQREQALGMIADNPDGGIFIMGIGDKHIGRGIGTTLVSALYSYGYHTGRDVVTASYDDLGFAHDERDFAPMGKILQHLGLNRIHLMTNNPHKQSEINGFGIKITGTVPMELHIAHTSWKEQYLQARNASHTHDLSRLENFRTQYMRQHGVDLLERW